MLKQGLHFPLWQQIVLTILDEDEYQNSISQKLKVTYSHTLTIINELIKKEIVNKEKDNNNFTRSMISLTKKGKKVQEHLREIKNIIS